MAQESKKLGVALFGFGRAGQIHTTNLISHPKIQLHYVIDPLVEKTSEILKTKFGIDINQTHVCCSTKVDIVLSNSNIDAVVICAPTPDHYELVIKALNAGKSVFCEKPISHTIEEVIQCYELAKKKNCQLFCSFNRRFDPTLKELHQKAAVDKSVGNVQLIKCTARDNPKPGYDYLKTSGGIYHDCVVHDLDIILWLLNDKEYPNQVFAMGTAWDPEIGAMKDHDTAIIHLQYASGLMAVIDASRTAVYGYDQRVEVLGAAGMLQTRNQRDSSLVEFKLGETKAAPYKHSFPQRYRDSYSSAMNHFVGLCFGEEKEVCTFHNVLNISRLASVCEESAKLNKPLPFSPVFP